MTYDKFLNNLKSSAKNIGNLLEIGTEKVKDYFSAISFKNGMTSALAVLILFSAVGPTNASAQELILNTHNISKVSFDAGISETNNLDNGIVVNTSNGGKITVHKTDIELKVRAENAPALEMIGTSHQTIMKKISQLNEQEKIKLVESIKEREGLSNLTVEDLSNIDISNDEVVQMTQEIEKHFKGTELVDSSSSIVAFLWTQSLVNSLKAGNVIDNTTFNTIN